MNLSFQDGFENPEEPQELPPEAEYEEQAEYIPDEGQGYEEYTYDDEQEEY